MMKWPPERRTDIATAATLVLLPFVVFADVIFGLRTFYIRDIARFLQPLKRVLREIVLAGEFPYWNPYLSAGQPLAANPQYEVFYPLNWLIFLPDFDAGFRLLLLIHLSIALAAMYALLRSMSLRAPASFAGAVAWGLGGLSLSYLNLLPLLFTAAWIPLTCLFARRALKGGGLRDAAIAALCFGVQCLVAEPTTLLQTAMLIAAYAIFRGVRDRRPGRTLILAAAIGLGGVLAGAVQIVPAVDHARDSARSRGLPYPMVSRWSMPPVKLAELVYPNFLGHPVRDGRIVYWGGAAYGDARSPFLLSIYAGLLPAVAAMAGLLSRRRGWTLVAALVATSVLLALGDHTPLLRLLYGAGIDSIRYFEKFILTGVFALIVFGAHVLDAVIAGDERLRKLMIGIAAASTVVSIAAWCLLALPGPRALFLRTWHIEHARLAAEFLTVARQDWLVAALRGSAVVLLLIAMKRIRRRIWVVLTMLFVVADLAPLTNEVSPRASAAMLDEIPPAATTLQGQGRGFRIFHEAQWHGEAPIAWQYARVAGLRPEPFRNGLFPPVPAEFGLQSVLDVDYDLTALLPTADFTDAAHLVRLYGSRARWPQPVAAMSNAWFRAMYRPFQPEYERAQGDITRINPVVFVALERHPRYYFADRVVTIRDRDAFVRHLVSEPLRGAEAFIAGPSFVPARGIVRRWSETANTIRIEAESRGRALLVMSVTPHKYWRASIDGRRATPIVANIGYQALELGPGRHVVEMRYHNPLIAAGAAVSALAWLVLGGIAITMRAL